MIDCRHPAAEPFIAKRMRKKYNQIEKYNNLLIPPSEMKILKEMPVCDEGCKAVYELLEEKSKIVKDVLEQIQNHLDKEL